MDINIPKPKEKKEVLHVTIDESLNRMAQELSHKYGLTLSGAVNFIFEEFRDNSLPKLKGGDTTTDNNQ